MQLAAEQASGAKALIKITSFSQHALEQIAGRDGGIGISQSALNSAWSNPLKIDYVPVQHLDIQEAMQLLLLMQRVKLLRVGLSHH